VTETYTI